MTVPSVSAIVVTWQSEETIGAALEALRQEGRRLPLETIVVDNASTDATVDRAVGADPSAIVIRCPVNLGFAAAVNRGAARAAGRHLLLLNPDAEPLPGAVAELAGVLDAHPGVAACGPRLVAPDGRSELSDGPHPGFFGEAWQRLRASLPGRERRARSPRVVDWLTGACLLVRAADFRSVGGMDEGFFLYFEDADLCARLRALGRDVVYWPRAVVRHRRGHSMARAGERAALEYRRSQLRFYRKHHGAEAEALLRAYLRLAGRPLPPAG